MPDNKLPKIKISELNALLTNPSLSKDSESYIPRSMTNTPESQYDDNFALPKTMDDYSQRQALEDYKGYAQPTPHKWANAVPRLIGKVGLEIAKTPGYIAAGIEALATQDLVGALDNSYLQMLEGAESGLKEQFAVYKPKWVREGGIGAALTSASFYTDEGVDGLGFLIAMMAPGAAAKSLNLAGSIAKTGAAARMGKLLGTTSQSIGRNIELGSVTLVNSSLEALTEAKGVSDDLKKQLTGKTNPLTGKEYTIEEIDKIRGEAAKGTFWTNMGILLVPNAIMNKQLLGRFSGTKTALNEMVDEFGNKIVTNATKKNSLIKSYLKEIGKTSISEGLFEEGMQEATTNYYKDKSLGKTDKDWLEGMVSAYGDMLGTTEGQKAVILGALLGGGSSVVFHGREIKAEKEYKNKLSNLLNNTVGSYLDAQHPFVKDKDGNIVYEKDSKGNIIMDETEDGEIIPRKKIDLEKAAKLLNMNLSAMDENAKMELAAAMNDPDTYKKLYIKNFTNHIIPYLGVEHGTEIINRQIDNLSEQLSKDAKEALGSSYNEGLFKQQLKEHVKQLETTYGNLSDYMLKISEYLPKDKPEDRDEFVNKLFNSAINETSKQLYLTQNIKDLENELAKIQSPLNLSDLPELPQAKRLAEDIIKRLTDNKKELKESIETYEKLFNSKDVNATYNDFLKDKKKFKEALEKAQQEWQAKRFRPANKEEVTSDRSTNRVEEIKDPVTSNIADKAFTNEGTEEDFKESNDELRNQLLERKTQLEQRLDRQLELEHVFNNAPKMSDLRIGENVRWFGREGYLNYDNDYNLYTFTDAKTNKTYEIPKIDGDYRQAYEHGIIKSSKPSVLDRIEITGNSVAPAKFITIDGKQYVNNYSNPLMAINRDIDGNVVSVTLDTIDGKPRTFRKYADEIAYAIILDTYKYLTDETKPDRKDFEQRLAEEVEQNDLTGKEQVSPRPYTQESQEIEDEIAEIDRLLGLTTKHENNVLNEIVVGDDPITKEDALKDIEQNEEETIGEDDESANKFTEGSAKRDISYFFNTTRGVDDSNYPHMKRWFDYTSKIRGMDLSNYTLVLVHKGSQSAFKDKTIHFYNDGDIVAILHKDNKPVIVDNNYVYTSIPNSRTLEEVKSGKEMTVKNKFLTDTAIQSIINDYDKFRDDVLKSNLPVTVKALNTTRGIRIRMPIEKTQDGKPIYRYAVNGRMVDSDDAIKDIGIKIGESKEELVGTEVIDTVQGLVYLYTDTQTLPARVAKLSEIPNAVDKVISLLEELHGILNNTGKSKRIAKDVYDDINKITLFGSKNNSSYKIFITADNKLNFNNSEHEIEDSPELRDFLNNKYFRVNKSLLNHTGTFTDPITGYKWPSYKHYLLSDVNRQPNEIPVGVNIQLSTNKQYEGVGITFDTGIKEEEKVTIVDTKEKATVGDYGDDTSSVTPIVDNSNNTEPITLPDSSDITASDDPFNLKEQTNKLDIDDLANNQNDTLSDRFKLEDPSKPATQEELNKEEEWFKANFPQIEYSRIKGLIDHKAVGKFISSGKVLVSDNAPIGTTYHEAFHVVFNLFLNESDRKKLLKDSRVGNQTDLEVEEELAEEFRSYMNGDRNFTPTKRSFFRKLLDFIKSLLGLSTIDKATLFKNIKEGAYKSSKFINKRNSVSRYMVQYNIPGKDVAWTADLMESMNVFFFNRLFLDKSGNIDIDQLLSKDNAEHIKNVFDGVFQDFVNSYKRLSSENKANLKEDYNYIINNWGQIVTTYKTYVKRFGLSIGITVDNANQADTDAANSNWEDLIGEEEITTKDSAFMDQIHLSTKDQMGKVVKAMLSSLPVKNKDNSVKTNRFGTPSNLNFKSIVALLNEELSNLQTLEQMINKLEELKQIKPEINTILKYLNINATNIFPETATLSQALLITKFFQVFATNKENFTTMLLNGDGNMVFIDSNGARRQNIIRDTWANNLKESINKDNKGLYILKDDGSITINQSYLNETVKEANLKDINSVVDTLAKLGITFSNKNWTNQTEIATLINGLLAIKNWAVNAKDITSIFQKNLISGPINKLVELEAKYNKDAIDHQHISADGKTVYEINKNTYLSIILNQINNEGIDSIEHLKDVPYVQDSLWYNGLKEGKKLAMVTLSGLRINEPGEEGTITSELGMADLTIIHLNALLNSVQAEGGLKAESIYPMLRASDGKLERGFRFDMDMNRQEFLEQMFKYYSTDLKRSLELVKNGVGKDINIYNKNALQSVIFENIITNQPEITKDFNLDEYLINNKQDIINKINNWMTNEILSIKSNLEKYKLLYGNDGYYSFPGLSKNNRLRITNKENNLTVNEIIRILEEVVIKSTIGNIEQSKIFFGDFAYYEIAKGGVNKRAKGLTGPKKMALTDNAFNIYLEKKHRRTDGKLQNGKFNTIVYEDVKVRSEYIDLYNETIGKDLADDYNNVNEADAQGVITLPAYKELMLRMGDWTPTQDEAYEKLQKGETLSKNELALFPPLKPQYFGPQQYKGLFVPTYYKFSLMPLIPQVIKVLGNSNLSKLNEHMLSNGIDLSMFESANKVGHKLQEGKKVPFYKENGTFNDNNLTLQTIDLKYLGIQVDNAPIQKNKTTKGSQANKLSFTNLFEQGEARRINVLDSRTNTFGEKDALELKREYDSVNNEITSIYKQNLEKELTLTKDSNGNYKVGDLNIFKNMLLEAATDRDSNNVLIKSIINALNDDIRALDFTLQKNKIEQLLNSLINNNIIKQKMFGDMKIQAASTGLEVGARKFKDLDDGTKKLLGNDILRFYNRIKEGEEYKGPVLTMQVMLPNYLKELFGKNVDVKNIDKKLLEVIGFRIPTQGLNSIDSIEVVGFLPPEAGNMIITPSEITVKAGSDYDVDKLTIYMPNYIMIDGKPIYLETDDKGLKKIYNTWIKYYKSKLDFWNEKNKDMEKPMLSKTFSDMIEDDELSELIINKINKYGKDASITFDEFKSKYRVKQLQNRIIEITKEVLSSPEVFEDLITPNSAKILEDIAKRISSKQTITGTSIISWWQNLRTAQAFWVGKAGVGITALHNTFHTLSQQSNLYINKVRTDANGNETVQAYINFKHNQTKDGNISLGGIKDANDQYKISNIISQFLNAFVDVAKDPFIIKINATTRTANTWFYLLRSGVSVDTVANFMNQPIIRTYLEYSSINESIINDKELSVKKLVDKIKLEYGFGDSSVKNKLKNQNRDFTDKLEKWLKPEDTKDVEFLAGQIQILDDFLHYEEIGKELASLQKGLAVDTKGVGKNRMEARMRYDSITKHSKKGLFGNLNNLIHDTVLKGYYDTLIDAKDYYNDLFITDKKESRPVLDFIEEDFDAANYTDDTKAELMNLVENEFVLYLLETIKIDDHYLSKEIERLFTTKDGPSLAQQVLELKKDKSFENNQLVKELFAKIDEGSIIHNIKMFSKKLNTVDTNILSEAFEQLANTQEYYSLMRDIVKLGIMQSGLNNSPISFNHIVPADLFFEIARPIIIKYLNNNNIDITSFVDQFYMNNYLNNKIVPKSFVKPEGTTIRIKQDSNLAKRQFVKVWENHGSKDIPLWKVRIFKKMSSTDTNVIFEEVPTLGDGYKLHRYYPSEDFDTNNLTLTDKNSKFAEKNTRVGQYEDINSKIETTKQTKGSYEEDNSFMNRIDKALKAIETSGLSDKDQQEFRQKLSKVKNEEDLNSLAKELQKRCRYN